MAVACKLVAMVFIQKDQLNIIYTPLKGNLHCLTGRATERIVASTAQTKFKIAKHAKLPKNLHPLFFELGSIGGMSDFSKSMLLELSDGLPADGVQVAVDTSFEISD